MLTCHSGQLPVSYVVSRLTPDLNGSTEPVSGGPVPSLPPRITDSRVLLPAADRWLLFLRIIYLLPPSGAPLLFSFRSSLLLLHVEQSS